MKLLEIEGMPVVENCQFQIIPSERGNFFQMSLTNPQNIRIRETLTSLSDEVILYTAKALQKEYILAIRAQSVQEANGLRVIPKPVRDND